VTWPFDVFQDLQAHRFTVSYIAFDRERTQSIEKKLRKIAVGDGVLAGDSFMSELPNDIAEKIVDGVGVLKIFDLGEELCGNGVGYRRTLPGVDMGMGSIG